MQLALRSSKYHANNLNLKVPCLTIIISSVSTSFTSSKIYESDTGHSLCSLVGFHVVVDLLEINGENGVTSATGVIHPSARNRPASVSHLHVPQNLGNVLDWSISEILDVWTFLGRLSDFKVVRRLVWRDGYEKVADVLIVYLEV